MTQDPGESMRSFVADMDWLAERFPVMRDRIEQAKREQAEHIQWTFQPLFDFADGKITEEEYRRITAERDAEEQARRRRHYGFPPDTDEQATLSVACEHCARRHEWDTEERGEWPPTYFECEDVDGVSCEEEAEDDG